MRRVNIRAAFAGEPSHGSEISAAEESDEAVQLAVRGGELTLVVPRDTADPQVLGPLLGRVERGLDIGVCRVPEGAAHRRLTAADAVAIAKSRRRHRKRSCRRDHRGHGQASRTPPYHSLSESRVTRRFFVAAGYCRCH